MVTVADDREADIYSKWARPREPKFHLLTRAMSDRGLADGSTLPTAVARLPPAGRRTIKLPARPPVRAKRGAVLEPRFGEVEICRPRDEPDRGLGRVPRSGVGAVGNWPARTTAESLGRAGQLPTAVVIAGLR